MIDPDPMQSREAYDAYVATWPKDQRWQWWPVPWRLATPGEKAVNIALWVGQGIIIAAALIAIIVLDGLLIDNYGRMVEQHDVCLRLASNGHEMVECDR